MAPTLRPRPTRTDFWQPLDFNVSTGRGHSTTNRGQSVSTRRTVSDPPRRTRSVQPPERVNPDPHHGVEARARTSGRSNGTSSSEVRRAPRTPRILRAPRNIRAPRTPVTGFALRRQLAGSSSENIRREMVQMSSGHSTGTSNPGENPPPRRPLPSRCHFGTFSKDQVAKDAAVNQDSNSFLGFRFVDFWFVDFWFVDFRFVEFWFVDETRETWINGSKKDKQKASSTSWT